MIVSIGIIVRNEEKNILSTLQNLIKLDFNKNEYEIIIVDGNSTDDTPYIIKNFITANQEFDIKLFFEKEHSSPGNARNIVLENALGKYVAFTDADCLVEKDWLQILVSTIKKERLTNNKVVAVGGIRYPIIDTINWKEALLNTMLNSFLGSGGSAGFMMKKNKFVVSIGNYNAIYFAKIARKTKYLPIAWGEDYEFNRRLNSEGYKIILSDKSIIRHHQEDSFINFLKQMYWYGWGQANVYKKSRFVRNFAPIVAIFSICFIFGWLTMFIYYPLFFLYLIVIASYFCVIIINSLIISIQNKKILYLFSVILFPLQHILYGIGFIKRIIVGH